MTEFLQSGLFFVVLTLLAYQIGLLCQRKFHSPIWNPILIAVILVLIFLGLTGISVADYQSGNARISWLMTPATVCLAIPMYEQFQILRKNIRAILSGVVSGALSCLVIVFVIAVCFGFDRTLTVSLLPKSVTSAIGAPISALSGGVASITTAAIILSGILANILSLYLFRLFRLTDPIAQGVALGTSGHVIATTKGNEISPLVGAVSSLSLVAAGLLTAAVLSVLLQWM